MTSKLHNRTLFVAALSVYFGLLIVGAPPQTLAQTSFFSQSLNRNSKQVCLKPGNDEIAKLLNLAYAEPIESFIKKSFPKIENIRRKENFPELGFQLEKYFSKSCIGEKPYQISYITDGSSNPTLFHLANDLANGVSSKLAGFLSDCEQNAKIKDSLPDYAVSAIFDGNKELVVKTRIGKFSAQEAERIAEDLNQSFAINACLKRQIVSEAVYRNSTARLAGNKSVLVVTRLPRAALDTLVGANEKAN